MIKKCLLGTRIIISIDPVNSLYKAIWLSNTFYKSDLIWDPISIWTKLRITSIMPKLAITTLIVGALRNGL